MSDKSDNNKNKNEAPPSPESSPSEPKPLQAKPEGPNNVTFRTNLEYATVLKELKIEPQIDKASTPKESGKGDKES